MRFASALTAIAAVAAAPLLVAANGPHMQPEAFVSAVRCTAFQSAEASDGLGAVKYQLNTELRRQSAPVAAEAAAAVREVAARADGVRSAEDVAIFRKEGIAACAGAGEMVARRSLSAGDV